jgi:hypothetical protein
VFIRRDILIGDDKPMSWLFQSSSQISSISPVRFKAKAISTEFQEDDYPGKTVVPGDEQQVCVGENFLLAISLGLLSDQGRT